MTDLAEEKLLAEERRLWVAWQLGTRMPSIEGIATDADAIKALDRLESWIRWAKHVLQHGLGEDSDRASIRASVTRLCRVLHRVRPGEHHQSGVDVRNSIVELLLRRPRIKPVEPDPDDHPDGPLLRFVGATLHVVAGYAPLFGERLIEQRDKVVEAVRAHRSGKSRVAVYELLRLLDPSSKPPANENLKDARDNAWKAFKRWRDTRGKHDPSGRP